MRLNNNTSGIKISPILVEKSIIYIFITFVFLIATINKYHYRNFIRKYVYTLSYF